MPRTVDLRKVRNEFVDGPLASAETAWAQPPLDIEARRLLAENTFLRVAIGWEIFISEWFIGCLSHDTTRFRHALEARIQPEVQTVFDRSILRPHLPKASAPSSTLPRQPGKQTVVKLIDPTGRNLEFSSLQNLIQEASVKLAPRYAKRAQALPGLGMADVIEPAMKIRNAISHRSQKSVREMNLRIRNIAAIPALRKLSVSSDGVGTYLAAPIAGRPRLLIFKDRFEIIASTLAP